MYTYTSKTKKEKQKSKKKNNKKITKNPVLAVAKTETLNK